MFQVVDDLLDVTQSTEHVGKATGKDSALGKRTYPGLLGIEGSQQVVVDQLRESSLHGPGATGLLQAWPPCGILCCYMAVRTR